MGSAADTMEVGRMAPKKSSRKEKGGADTQVRVTYKYIDGAHFFVGEDKMAAGLCVAHADFATAFEEVSRQLKLLFKYNHGIETEFVPATPMERFKLLVEAWLEDGHGVIVPSATQPWMNGGGKGMQ